MENELPSRLHSKLAKRLEPGVAVTWNLIDVETVELPFCTGFPLPSRAEVIVVCVGGCTGVVEMTETSLPGALAIGYELISYLMKSISIMTKYNVKSQATLAKIDDLAKITILTASCM